eukprot:gb/GECG01007624.1/.p1 GENE.gb/GECG01007624.1/~~gb/GECG01007624.1/.p1  ORF type:complete len:250 (+),score=17.71 gb/GECG01007624.1/:1-750(+)
MHWGIGLAMTAALVAIWVPFLKIFEQSNTGFREELWTLYENELKPIEEQCHYHDFVSPPLTKADIMYDVPMVLLTGLYSTGKTTFISHLLGEDYPQARVGPQPTTDKFVAVMKNETRGTIAGHAIINQNDLPFSSLDSLGGDFLDHFMGSFSPARLLDHVSFIDTPGVLSGKASMIQRGYDYPEVSVIPSTRSSFALRGMLGCTIQPVPHDFFAVDFCTTTAPLVLVNALLSTGCSLVWRESWNDYCNV